MSLPLNVESIRATFTANGTISIPPGRSILQIRFRNTTANAVTGGIRIGTTTTGTDVVVAQAVAANAHLVIKDAAVLKNIFSISASTPLFIEAVTAWNSASVKVEIITVRTRE